MSVTSTEGFAIDEYITGKTDTIAGYVVEILKIEDINVTDKKLYVERGVGVPGDYTELYSWIFTSDDYGVPDNYTRGQVFVSIGVSGSGYITFNAEPTEVSTPYMDV